MEDASRRAAGPGRIATASRTSARPRRTGHGRGTPWETAMSFLPLPADGDPPDPERTESTDQTPPAGRPPGATLTTLGEPTSPASGSSVIPAPPGLPARYHLAAQLAHGAMGLVFRGRDTAFGRDVAVKILLEGHLGKRELRRRFTDEARITAGLQHPGVVPVYEAGEL